tara:strand:+ start:211 stop:1068 length:858 start_codon:yes stop_codon:yes gene_type:complete
MSRPRVIKNKGVAVVEGTPAASLIKDVDRFFASKPRERMAGENIGEARTIQTEDNTMFMGGSKDFNEKTGSRLGTRKTRKTIVDSEGFTAEEPQADTTGEGEIMSKEEYREYAKGIIDKGKKRGVMVTPVPYNMYVQRQQPEYKAKQAARQEELKQRQKEEGSEPRRKVKPSTLKTPGGIRRDVMRKEGELVERKPVERHGRPIGGNPNKNKAEENFTIQGFPSESPPLTREETDKARQEIVEKRRDKAKERANRFRGRRSAMEADRSTEEQKATEGKFISTLRR